MLATRSRIPDGACALLAMAGGRDCPLVFDWACVVHAHIGRSVQNYVVIILWILHTPPADVHPLSACRYSCTAGAKLYALVKRVAQVVQLKQFKCVLRILATDVLAGTNGCKAKRRKAKACDHTWRGEETAARVWLFQCRQYY